jgi:hypothetical protein
MAKQSWNRFTKTNPAAPAFTARARTSLSKRGSPHLDKKGQKLPTPYGLLVEWLAANLSGDWTSMAAKGAAVVKVVDQADAAAILKRFPAVGSQQKTAVSPTTQQINYQDQDYPKLAVQIGYTL